MSEQAFRIEVLGFLRDALPADMAARGQLTSHPSRSDYLAWQATLAARGWGAPGWPIEHGGAGWTGRQRQIFEEEALLAGAPPFHIQSIFLIGPLIAAFGTPEQKRDLLPDIREGRELWAQGFSEPNSGSDLASLRTRAVRDGDHYVVNGQKIWTSDGQYCDRMFALVRTNSTSKPQAGISMLMFPLDLPGITIRPIALIDDSDKLSEVFFDDVRVPVDGLLGKEGQGWTYAKFLLDAERTTTAEVPRNRRELARLRKILASQPTRDGVLIDDPGARRRLAELECDFAALETGVAAVLDVPHGAPVGVAPSILKIQGTELMQATLEAEVAALGAHGIVAYDLDPARNDQPGPIHAPGVSAEFLFRRAATIYGGSTEIQLGIIGRTLKQMAEAEDESAVTDEQAMLRDSIRRFVKAPSDDVWAMAAEQGWLAATLPETVGGLGGSVADGTVIAREFGRGMITAPLTDALMAVRSIAATGAYVDLVTRWAEGKVRLAFAHDELGARGSPFGAQSRAVQRDGWRLSGRKLAVADGAELLIVTARTSDCLGLFLVETTAINQQRYATIDGRFLNEVALNDTPAEAIALDGATAITNAIGRGMLDFAAEAVGLMERAFWICRDYLATRNQFGRALIEFQVLEHRLARMMMEIARARAMVRYGLNALELHDPNERMRRLSAVKSRVGRSAVAVGQQAVQLHGGIALTREYPIGAIFARIMVVEAMLGNSDDHLTRVGDALAAEIKAAA